MRSFSLPQFIYPAVLLSAGLALGWWLADRPPAEETKGPELAQTQTANPQREQGPEAGSRPPHKPQAEGSQAETETETDSLERFRALLKAQAFQPALDLYQRTERLRPWSVPSFKELLLETMEAYLRSGQSETLTRLVEAFLARYYDDLDVLLILARQQTQSGYYLEAVQSFQLAHNYALARPGEQPKLEEALNRFVHRVDQHLASQHDWPSLLHFYHRLQHLGLARPEHRLRQAELQLHRGDPDIGRRVLQRLARDPSLAARATALLEQNQVPVSPPPSPERQGFEDSIPLGLAGGHFHLPVHFNNNREFNLIIDTGASLTALSRDSFDQLGADSRFTPLGHQLFNTAGGPVQGQIYQVEQVRLGRQQLTDVRIAVLDFELPDNLDGLLGMNLLRHFRFEVDQERQQLHLQPR